MSEIYVVLGGNGFIGYSVIKELSKKGKIVRCVDHNMIEDEYRLPNVDYIIGDVNEKSFLKSVFDGVTSVLDFMATSMPNSNDVTIISEINNTLTYYDHVLSTMNECGVKQYIFPSSGGAVYGNTYGRAAKENDALQPITPYGIGKQLTEDIIKYYYNKCGINSYIFRIGNVYGSPRIRRKAQGALDIFVQNALLNKKITIWGDAEHSIRDYIFLDDLAEGIVSCLEKNMSGCHIYNLGTGIGTSLADLIEIINEQMHVALEIEYKKSFSSGVNSIILSSEKINDEIGWKSKTSLIDGVKKTIEIKRGLIQKKW